MRMGDGVEWGLHAVTLLAALPEGQALPAARLAEYHAVPAAYMAKHLQALARSGVLETVRGRHGGYRVARPAASITVLEVVEALIGPEPVFRCTEIRRRGPAAGAAREYRSLCAVHRTMLRADDAWRAALRDTTVADLVATVLREANPRAIARGGRWLQEVLR